MRKEENFAKCLCLKDIGRVGETLNGFVYRTELAYTNTLGALTGSHAAEPLFIKVEAKAVVAAGGVLLAGTALALKRLKFHLKEGQAGLKSGG